jgi:hypothetical protein
VKIIKTRNTIDYVFNAILVNTDIIKQSRKDHLNILKVIKESQQSVQQSNVSNSEIIILKGANKLRSENDLSQATT